MLPPISFFPRLAFAGLPLADLPGPFAWGALAGVLVVWLFLRALFRRGDSGIGR